LNNYDEYNENIFEQRFIHKSYINTQKWG
jgi:hypothetical protein